MKIKDKEATILISESEIKKQVKKLGKKITTDYQDKELLVIGILKGSFIFVADLVREIKLNVYVDFMQVSSYKTSMESSGEVIFVKDLTSDVKNKHVLIVDDIIDTGRTLEALVEALKQRNPKSIKTCVLLDKKERREVDFDADYVGFVIPDKFVIGYGLDWAEEGRTFKDIYALEG